MRLNSLSIETPATRVCLLVLATTLGVGVGCNKKPIDPTPVTATDQAKNAAESSTSAIDGAVKLYNQGRLEPALRAAEDHLVAVPTDATALTLVVQIQNDLGNKQAAAEAAEALSTAMPEDAGKILVRAHYWYIETKRFADAERVLRTAAENDSTNVEAHRSLASLLCAQGRRSESVEPLKQLIRLRVAQPNELMALVDIKSPFQLVSYAPYYQSNDGSFFNLGDALKSYAIDNQPDVALELLESLIRQQPEFLAASALKGRILIECGRRDEFDQWLIQCTREMAEHPDYWSALGLARQLRSETLLAAEAYARAIELDPTDRNSLRGLAECLDANGESEQAKRVRERLVQLERVFRIAKDANAERCREISTTLQSLTRPLESTGWLMLALQQQGQRPSQQSVFQERITQIAAWEKNNPPEARQKHWLSKTVGLERRRAPQNVADSGKSVPPASEVGESPVVQFVEKTSVAGLPIAGPVMIASEEKHVPFLYQTTGAGIAVFDFDLDGKADLYESRCLHEPLKERASSTNRLYRQVSKQRFEDKTELSAVGDQGFGQGVTSGDVNQDGFPDLLVGNFGKNRLYINQGDGTFRVADSPAFAEDSWTTSVALADLSGDGLPEIIEVNYIDDPAAPTRPCPLGTACTPQQMIPAEDNVYLAQANGTFAMVKKRSEATTASYGMGLVVSAFSDERSNEVFVGNDAEYNQFWSWNPKDGTLMESALARGCAVGRNGNSQACMGIASGDFNGDGTLDLHVTNFLNEPANLFMQTASGVFSDDALQYGLFKDSSAMLGFGTQAGDFNHDGHLDLIRLNGHVYGDPAANVPFRMPPQQFLGGSGPFKSVVNNQGGEYFEQATLGRALATTDWDRDGDLDLIATHLDRPLALLENTTPNSGHWLQFELIGTNSERDAVGTKMTITCGGRRRYAWRTTGDGYLCKNESAVHIGLGEDTEIDQVTVRWPNGTDQTFTNLACDRRYRIIEGHAQAELVW
ncbi:MAG: FG-GAP-like repeat-containing protein [Planctomycetota bacterium]